MKKLSQNGRKALGALAKRVGVIPAHHLKI